MGFTKRFINFDLTIQSLNDNTLRDLYDCNALILNDDDSSKIYQLYLEGKTEQEILKIYSRKIKNYNNEKYKSN